MKAIGRVGCAAVVVLSLESYAHAASHVFNVISGAICQGPSGSVQQDKWGIKNNSGTAAVVACALPMPNSSAGTAYLSGTTATNCGYSNLFKPYVTVYDRHSSQNVSCTLFALGFDGNTHASWSVASSSSQGSAQTLWFPFTDRWVVSNYTWYLECSIPPPENGAVSHVTSVNMSFCTT
jgi:hypothetical protein